MQDPKIAVQIGVALVVFTIFEAWFKSRWGHTVRSALGANLETNLGIFVPTTLGDELPRKPPVLGAQAAGGFALSHTRYDQVRGPTTPSTLSPLAL
jgi:hypothetical protein